MGQPEQDEPPPPAPEEASGPDGVPTGEPVAKKPSRRLWIIGGIAAVVVLLLVAGGVTTFVLLSRPDRPAEVVDAYLQAVRDGDIAGAVPLWADISGVDEGKPGLRERVRTYLDGHRDAYKKALTGRTWTVAEYQARLGTGVNVTLDGVTVTYLLLGSDDEGWMIFLGPEDTLGRPSSDGNPLLKLAVG
jgi:hypothetical protein